MEWLDPWCDVAELGPDFAATFEGVLAREVAPGHPLHGIPVSAVGKRNGTDDVLFRLLDKSGRFAAVHLTWTRSPPERPPWPFTEIFADFKTFIERRMRPEHEEAES